MRLYPERYIIIILMICLGSCKQSTEKQETVKAVPEWYSNAFIYNLDVETFKDSNGDGTGDFNGLTQKLGYLDTLGVDVIWLAPFQPTPNGDDGYDETDYYGIDKNLGTAADFQNFMAAAKKKGIKVIMDLVLNHTSSGHDWFKMARADTTSKYHSWYVWSDKKPGDADKGLVFPGVQTETWTFDEATKKYYFHRFYDFEPDLNYEEPQVREMAADVLRYWLKKGVDGFRLDAVPFIIDLPKTGSANPKHMFDLLTSMRKTVQSINPNAVLLGEANVTAEENKDFFGTNGNRLQMMFNFYVNQYLFYSLAREDPESLKKALEEFRLKPATSQWAFFLRNHDEVDLARLTKSQRSLVFKKFGPESNMQIYDRGIRRRLAPMLADPALIRMSYSLLFSFPGAPVIRYGEEIGMGDDLTLQERLSVRTPMQWDRSANSGFSTDSITVRPVIGYGDYSFQKVNVADESADKNSLLSFIKNLVEIRKLHPEIGLGEWKILDAGNSNIMAIQYLFKGKQLIAVHNFSKSPQQFSLEEKAVQGADFTELTGGKKQVNIGNGGKIQLNGYGFQWYTAK
ncbi:MAG: alpha-amylase family protein [Pedobacter sp.]|uniref:alpha-amylase family protein n=1 Tax=Pedobacter sp. TaxID=1411316 RepID=UPI003393E5DA